MQGSLSEFDSSSLCSLYLKTIDHLDLKLLYSEGIKQTLRFELFNSDSFTILGLWVLGLVVSNINESQLQTYES